MTTETRNPGEANTGAADLVKVLCGLVDASALVILEGLPDWIGGRP